MTRSLQARIPRWIHLLWHPRAIEAQGKIKSRNKCVGFSHKAQGFHLDVDLIACPAGKAIGVEYIGVGDDTSMALVCKLT